MILSKAVNAHRSGESGSLADASPGQIGLIGRRRRAAVGGEWALSLRVGTLWACPPGGLGASQTRQAVVGSGGRLWAAKSALVH